MIVETRIADGGCGALCERLLATLPDWFGLAEANAAYVADAERLPSVVASVAGEDVGILTLKRHSPTSAEVHLMAVHIDRRGQGIGRAMIHAAESSLAMSGVRFLQVKTLSATDPDVNYAATRGFYESAGFTVLEEMPELWDADNPAVVYIKTIG